MDRINLLLNLFKSLKKLLVLCCSAIQDKNAGMVVKMLSIVSSSAMERTFVV
jgi:hypothetical protein